MITYPLTVYTIITFGLGFCIGMLFMAYVDYKHYVVNRFLGNTNNAD